MITREYPDGFSKSFSCSAGEATLDRVPLGTFNLLIDGSGTPARIVVGANNRRPSKMPFTITKWESHPR